MLFNVIIKTEGVVMERSIEIVNLVKEKLNEYVEELKKQNEKREKQANLLKEIDALKADAEELKGKAKQISAADKAVRDEKLKPLIELLGLKIETSTGYETVRETRTDRDGDYTVNERYLRGYACLVDKFGHTIHKVRVFSRWDSSFSTTKADLAAVKAATKESFDVLSLLIDYMNSEKALTSLKETYLIPENWELRAVEAEIKKTVHDIGLDAVKETLKELKKQRPSIEKEFRAVQKKLDYGYFTGGWERSDTKVKCNVLKNKLSELNDKIEVHENAIKLYARKEELIKFVARVKLDVGRLGYIEAIDSIVPAQEKYFAVKAEEDKTLESVENINKQITKMQNENYNLSSTIDYEDKMVTEQALKDGKITEFVNGIVNEEFVNSPACETVRKDCYLLLSAGKLDKIDEQIAQEVFDRIESLREQESEME